MNLNLLFLLIVVFVLSWAGTWGIRWFALRHSLLDIPNQRSSHSRPTPRGGGVALVIGLYLGGGVLFLTQRIEDYNLMPLAGCGLAVAVLGLLDDLFQLSAFIRIVVQALCVLLAVFFIPSDRIALVPGAEFLPLPVLRLLLVVAILWLLNLFNFMDGIDGLAASEAFSVALGGAVILFLGQGPGDASMLLLLILAASTLGFLLRNWPPAKIFMGDACSGFLGFFFAILGLLSLSDGGMTLWSWLLLLGTFVVDATVTLLVRIRRGDKFYQAHRSHAYQILARRTGGHGRVTLLYTAIFWFFLFPLAVVSVYWPQYGPFLVIFSYILLAILCMMTGAGTTND